MISTLLAAWRKLSNVDRIAGLFWYPLAWQECKRIADEAGWISPVSVAGIVAARSPLQSWQGNLTLARRDVQTGRARGALFADRSQAILDGARPGRVLSGDKTRAFFVSIARQGETDAVALDRHMLRLLYGEAVYKIRRQGEYQRAAACLREAAAEVGLRAATFQACLWSGERGAAW